MRVVATRERGRNDALRDWLPASADLVEVPVTATRFRDAGAVAEEAQALGAAFARALVVTSTRAVGYVERVAGALAPGAAVWSIGAATQEALARVGWPPSATAPRAGAIAEQIVEGPVLALVAREARDELGEVLTRRGIAWRALWCYETVEQPLDADARRALASADAVVIGAPSAWRVAGPHVPPSAWVVVPGLTTADAVRREHERVLVGWDRTTGARLAELTGPPGADPA